MIVAVDEARKARESAAHVGVACRRYASPDDVKARFKVTCFVKYPFKKALPVRCVRTGAI